jgi:hypothetical protein
MPNPRRPISIHRDSVTLVLTSAMLYHILLISQEKNVTLLGMRRNGERITDVEGQILPWIAAVSQGDVKKELTFAFIFK